MYGRYLKLALKLLRERSLGRASPLQPYLEVLPEDVDTPVLWTEQQLQQLQYAHLQEQVRGAEGAKGT